MGRFKYNPGDKIGPHNILMLERTYKDNSGHWYGKFLCPVCHNAYEAQIDSIVRGKSSNCNCKRVINLLGQRFGKLTVVKQLDKRKNGCVVWECMCDCGTKCERTSAHLLHNKIISCGCSIYRDISNQKFGLLTAINPTEKRDNHGSVIWECKCECGNTYEASSRHLLDGGIKSCGCLNSKGEQKIKQILASCNINFITQYTFDKCKNPITNYPLKFDFYIPDYNACIEYDGIQHFNYKKSGWDTKENFEKIQYRDSIKNQYCIDNNIKLIRIPYWDYDKLDKEYILDKLK